MLWLIWIVLMPLVAIGGGYWVWRDIVRASAAAATDAVNRSTTVMTANTATAPPAPAMDPLPSPLIFN